MTAARHIAFTLALAACSDAVDERGHENAAPSAPAVLVSGPEPLPTDEQVARALEELAMPSCAAEFGPPGHVRVSCTCDELWRALGFYPEGIGMLELYERACGRISYEFAR